MSVTAIGGLVQQRNMFCSLEDLSNEAAVEQFFVARLLPYLGYSDGHVKPKTSLDKLTVNLGRKRLRYRPDFAIELDGKPRWVIEAKAPEEELTSHIGQCASYCLNLNRRYPDTNPVRYFLLTNGVSTMLFHWDREEPILTMQFADFQEGKRPLKRIAALVGAAAFAAAPRPAPQVHQLTRRSSSAINAEFSWCHQFIYRKDNLSQSAAFMEFVKLVFLKLLSDRDLHNRYTPEENGNLIVPIEDVKFSTYWIEKREGDHPNPLDALQFQSLLSSFEEDIQRGAKKRIFPSHDHIGLSAETIKGVVSRIEHTDLFSIDEDLNGRLFETFLNATMRGKDLGQYFTPRSVIKMALKLARIQVGRSHIDTVIDSCCGSGGFLIDALQEMWSRVRENLTLTNVERERMKRTIALERLFGVDAAKDPPLASIARMNMYLHGDGGSSIYHADSLDKQVAPVDNDTAEVKREKQELKKLLSSGGFADVVLTNPPFAKEYHRSYPREALILDEYELAFDTRNGRRKPFTSLRSSVMFLERYRDILKPGGRMVAVIDDSILGGNSYGRVRDFLREHFIVRAVVSLPGDAFQRSLARVKTSLIVVQKKRTPEEEQPPVFMYYCTYVGIDDPARSRILPIDEINRTKAQQEVAEVDAAFNAFLAGKREAIPYTVPPEVISDRMDVKSCLPHAARQVAMWRKSGVRVCQLRELVDMVFSAGDTNDELLDANDLIDTSTSDELVTYLRCRYDGIAERGEEIYASDSTYSHICRVHERDIVISHINAMHGALCIVPKELDGCVVTTEYTVCRAKKGVDPLLVWMLLRTPEIRSDILLLASGIGRHRVRWDNVQELMLPLPAGSEARNAVDELHEADELERKAQELRDNARTLLENSLNLNTDEAQRILAAFKPPR